MNDRAKEIAAEAAERRRKRRAYERRRRLNNVLFISGLTVVVLVIIGAAWVVPSWMEARAFNKATGKSVTVWEAMFVDLRVQGEAK